jgi:hypothetical protein
VGMGGAVSRVGESRVLKMMQRGGEVAQWHRAASHRSSASHRSPLARRRISITCSGAQVRCPPCVRGIRRALMCLLHEHAGEARSAPCVPLLHALPACKLPALPMRPNSPQPALLHRSALFFSTAQTLLCWLKRLWRPRVTRLSWEASTGSELEEGGLGVVLQHTAGP